jgi:hypothetical protein
MAQHYLNLISLVIGMMEQRIHLSAFANGSRANKPMKVCILVVLWYGDGFQKVGLKAGNTAAKISKARRGGRNVWDGNQV